MKSKKVVFGGYLLQSGGFKKAVLIEQDFKM